eukprot:7154371-Pyramimonas_sp.AAC.1
MSMNSLKPRCFAGCFVVHPAIGVVQQKIVRPEIPADVRSLERMFELAISADGGASRESTSPCFCCGQHLISDGGSDAVTQKCSLCLLSTHDRCIQFCVPGVVGDPQYCWSSDLELPRVFNERREGGAGPAAIAIARAHLILHFRPLPPF